ncbi:hypothetical protein HFP89_03480 [Wenzhouxiangella sp. XN79A]|uniref:Mth938-like domain-containing protein n=1 Tax=Wenzhouxiangella sp. XN79A TaxID=2724193 RepID=UPI00144AE806|nr:MTH938/NDUFAF3 family protein [Wenzhouxiangella sp. XN79A]NKI34226.1 hypothetical protein [Wenzhouxiangella sp. XN79A]
MQLTEHRPDGQYYIHSLTDDAIRIVDTPWRESLLLTPQLAPTAWPVTEIGAVDRDAVAPILELRPDVVLLASGRQLAFPPREVQVAFLEAGIGLEVMTLESAARTFNVLASEERRVLAALIWEPAN